MQYTSKGYAGWCGQRSVARARSGLPYARHIQTKLKEKSFILFSDEPSRELYRGETESSGVFFGIGNEWQWDNFFIGCEWIGFGYNASHSWEVNYEDEAYQAANSSQVEEDLETIAMKVFHVYALQFQIGFSF